MSDIPIVLTCPFGHKCEELKDGAVHRCHLYQRAQGPHPNTGEWVDQWGCALAHQNLVLTHLGKQTYRTSQIMEDFRNKVVAQNKALLESQTLLENPND